MSGNIGETISNSDLNTCTICKFIIVDFTDCADPEIRCVNLRQQDHLLEAKSRKRLVPQPFRWLYVTSNFIQHCYCGITVNVNKTCHSCCRRRYNMTLHRESLRYLFHTTNICLDNKKLRCCCDSRSYCVRRAVYWQTILYRFRN